MEAPVPQASRAACREALSLNGVWRLLRCLILIFVALWLASGGGEPAEIDSIGGEVTGTGGELRRADGRAGRSGVPTGRDAPGRRRRGPYRRSSARRRVSPERGARSEAGR